MFCYVFSGLLCRSVDNLGGFRVAYDRYSAYSLHRVQLADYLHEVISACRADLSAS
jgi:hypothetical protein